MATGLRKNMRNASGKRIVSLSKCEIGPDELLPDGTTWFASFVGWGQSYTGSGKTQDAAIADLAKITGEVNIRETCIIRTDD